MLEDVKPLSISMAASAIGVDPFDLVRLLVARRRSGPMELSHSELDAFCEQSGIETWWPDGLELQPGPALLSRVLSEMLERRHTRQAATRLDNLWRGLNASQQEFIHECVETLGAQHWLLLGATATGPTVAIRLEEHVRRGVQSGSFPGEVARIWGGHE